MLVPIKKWLESDGRNFKWRVCNGPVLAASRGDTLRTRQTNRGEKSHTRGQRLPHSQPKTNWTTVEHDTFTLQTYDRVYIPIKCWGDNNSSPAAHNKQDRMTATEQLCSAGQRHCGVFWARLSAVTNDHHKLFISLTSQWWGGGSCGVTLLCPQAGALHERTRDRGTERVKLVPHVWERWVCLWKMKECFKTWLSYLDL